MGATTATANQGRIAMPIIHQHLRRLHHRLNESKQTSYYLILRRSLHQDHQVSVHHRRSPPPRRRHKQEMIGLYHHHRQEQEQQVVEP